MPTVQSFSAGGYRFISHQFQYSGGVAAEPGFRIERARFTRPVPRAEGFDAIEAYLVRRGESEPTDNAVELVRYRLAKVGTDPVQPTLNIWPTCP